MSDLIFKCTFIRSNGKMYTKKEAQSRFINHISNGQFSRPKYANLYSIKIPVGITSIGICAFRKCSQLREVTLHDGIFRIYENAFEYCTDLEEIVIPKTVQEIREFAFRGCSKLKVAKIYSQYIYIHERAFDKGVKIQYM